MVNRAPRGSREKGARLAPGRPHLPWKSLWPAIALSVVAHLLLLFTLSLPREARAPVPVLLV
ncbi:MAG TPA: hypothetical protein VFM98_20555, partial [Ramlibacter sp.]|uniref:hypothetical protein n=1 Tax=Ramlibacter sp. TaxID=1917967 RepID=UPI002D80DB22